MDGFVGLDLGTSGCRAIVIDRAARVLAEARQPLPPSARPTPGASEQDPAAWWDAASAVLRAIAEQAPGRLRALSVDGTSSTLLLCDADGSPLTPGLMYDDRRALRAARRVAAHAPSDSAVRGASSALAKLLLLLERPASEKARHALHQADWLLGRLTGRFGIADENNVLKLGYDPVARRWPAWLAGLAFPLHLLPEVVPVGEPVGRLRHAVAAQLGLPDDLIVVAGTTDGNAAALAAGIQTPGDAVTSLGSTLVLKVLSERPVNSATFGVYSHRLGQRWLVGGASNSGGRVLRQFFSDDLLQRLSAEIDPDRRLDLGYYPLPDVGERFPRADPTLRSRTEPRPSRPGDFLQALLEGIADIEAEGYRRLAELGAPPVQRVFSVGGGAINDAWRRIRQARLGVPVKRAAQTEAAYGAALLARDAMLAGAHRGAH